tara:strand:- start:1 stop:477 length:477 start_codon:yes stop_codon:yes gene_type:complete
MTYKGRYTVKNPHKYDGDPTKVVYRSLWERQVFKFMDANPEVIKWQSEETIIPYRCKTDNKLHRYFMDVKMVTKDKTYLIEIKPKKQTQAPKEPKRKTKRYITEVMSYIKNTSKWETAEAYCADRGWEFVIWTEETLKNLGIKLLNTGTPKKPKKKYK